MRSLKATEAEAVVLHQGNHTQIGTNLDIKSCALFLHAWFFWVGCRCLQILSPLWIHKIIRSWSIHCYRMPSFPTIISQGLGFSAYLMDPCPVTPIFWMEHNGPLLWWNAMSQRGSSLAEARIWNPDIDYYEPVSTQALWTFWLYV